MTVGATEALGAARDQLDPGGAGHRPGERAPRRAKASRRASPSGRLRLAAEAAAVAGMSWIWSAWLFRLWRAPLGLPLDNRSDTTLIASMIKTIDGRGWYLHQPRLGAPFGQAFYDFPHGGETFQLLAMRFITLFTHSSGLAMNIYFFAGFGVVAMVSHLVLRHLRFSFPVAAILALVYTFLPYRFFHFESHLWRSSYYSVPLAVLLLLWSGSWRSRFLLNPDPEATAGWRDNIRWPRVVAAAAVAVAVGGTETMSLAFTIVLLASAAVLGSIRHREPARLAVAGLMIAVLAGTFLVLNAPTLNYIRTHGSNRSVARRPVSDTETFGLKIIRMVTPSTEHRLSAFGRFSDRAQGEASFLHEPGQALGFLGTAGFVGALYAAVAGRRSRRRDVRPVPDRRALLEQSGTYVILAVLFGTVGGFAVLVSVAGFSQVRTWGRISIFIAFFSLIVVGIWLERLIAWMQRTGRRPLAVGGVLVAVLAFGLWDGPSVDTSAYGQIRQQDADDRAFVSRVEQLMPAGAAIFQFPIIPFPEYPPVGFMIDNEHLRGYLADSGSLRWSYGAMKGRPEADWQFRIRDQLGPRRALPALLGMGFTGLWADTAGYYDNPQELQIIKTTLGQETLRSRDGRFLFWDLRPYRERLGQSEAQLRQTARDLLKIEPPPARR